MAETKVKERYIGSSFKFQVVLPINFADCLEIEANVQSMNTDKQIISKNKKTATEGYKTLVVDTINPKAFWVYVESSESDTAFENLYECHLVIQYAALSKVTSPILEKPKGQSLVRASEV